MMAFATTSSAALTSASLGRCWAKAWWRRAWRQGLSPYGWNVSCQPLDSIAPVEVNANGEGLASIWRKQKSPHEGALSSGEARKCFRRSRPWPSRPAPEGFRLGDREIGQHLAIHFDIRLGKAVDEAAIGQAEFTHGGVDALESRARGRCASLRGDRAWRIASPCRRRPWPCDRVLAATVKAFGGLKGLLVLGVGRKRPV